MLKRIRTQIYMCAQYSHFMNVPFLAFEYAFLNRQYRGCVGIYISFLNVHTFKTLHKNMQSKAHHKSGI